MKKVSFSTGSAAYAAAIAANLIVQFVFAAIIAVGGRTDAVSFVASFCVEAAMFTAAAIVLAATKSKPTVAIRKPKANNLVLGLLIWFLTFAGGFWAALWAEKGLASLGLSVPGIRVDGWYFVPAVFCTCIAAPVCEETVFRSALLGGLMSRFSQAASVILSALAFALMHMSPFQFVFQLYLGVSLAIVAYRTQNLAYTMIMHAVSNLCALLLAFVPVDFTAVWWTIIPALLLIPSTLWGVITLSKGLKNESEDEAATDKENTGWVPYVIALAICGAVFATGFFAFAG